MTTTNLRYKPPSLPLSDGDAVDTITKEQFKRLPGETFKSICYAQTSPIRIPF